MEDQAHRLMALQFVSGSIAACGAVTITNPFDLLKTRRQLLNELHRHGTELSPRLVLRPHPISLIRIWRAEGWLGLQKGLSAAYLYQTLMNGTRFMVYEPLRINLAKKSGKDSQVNSLICNAVAGAGAGGLAAFIGSPFNLIKTRLQSYSTHFSTGHQHGYSNMREAIFRIWRGEGWRGLYRGVSASIMRTTAGSAAQLASYDAIKPWLASSHWAPRNKDVMVHLMAAMVSGVMASLVMNPFDVVMTRLYNQSSGAPLYKGIFDCAFKTVRVEGIMALWKGWVPHFVRVGPHTILTLVLLEQVRSQLRPLFMSPTPWTT